MIRSICAGWCLAVILASAVNGQQTAPPNMPQAVPTAESGKANDADPFADPPTSAVGGKVRLQVDSKVYSWSAGEPPVRLIRKSEGFCLLASIQGKFDAATDGVRVFVGPDDYWYLHGSSQNQGNVRATAMAIRFVARSPEPESRVGLGIGDVPHAKPGPAVRSDEALALIDLKSLQILPVELEGDRDVVIADRLWASADGTTFGMGRFPGASEGMLLTLRGKKAVISRGNNVYGYTMPSSDGRILFTPGGLYDDRFRPLKSTPWHVPDAASFLPCPFPAYYVGVSAVRQTDVPEVAIHAMADHRKLLILPTLGELGQGREDNLSARGVAWEERLFVLPAQQRVITLAAGEDRLFARTLDLLGQLDAADVDYLFVASLPPRRIAKGATYRYPLRVVSRRGHVECKLVSGPEGMTLDKDTVLTWTPGAKSRETESGVIISVRDASGQEIFHAFTIDVAEE